jgi:Cof subfamily protein (haloacid dehalogenase superfamily)
VKPTPTCRLLAIDLDGTLLDSHSRVPLRNREALHRAHEAGLKIVLCTGRSFTETKGTLAEIGLDLDATVTVGGALLTSVADGRTLERVPIDGSIAREALTWFRERSYATLWLHDADEAGFDGYAIDGPRRHPAIDRWLTLSPCDMRACADVPPAEFGALRVTILDEDDELRRVSKAFTERFAGRLNHNIIHVPAYGFTVIECFEATVDKWTGILRLCRRWGIDAAETAVIGDDVNDLPMIRQAGLGVAVANARPAVLAAAARVVASNNDAGVAELVASLL